MYELFSGAILFLTLSLVPGAQLGALREVGIGKKFLANFAADCVFWTVGLCIAFACMHLLPSSALWFLGLGCTVFLLGFLAITLRNSFSVPPKSVPAGSSFKMAILRWGLWFDAILIYPSFIVAMASDPIGFVNVALGALVVGFVFYGLVALPPFSARPAFWSGARITMGLAGTTTISLLSRQFSHTYPF